MYPIPAGRHRVEEVIRRSRFITTLAHAPDEGAAKAFVTAIQSEFPDATHNCWAFMAGPPGDTARVGMSDDGEPHGTAGRPMLTALLHGGVGEVAAVVTRYFGGVKLGKGGLGRAYAGGVKGALESLPTIVRVDRVPVRITVPFSAMDPLFRLLDEVGIEGREERYGEGVVVTGEVVVTAVERIRREVAGFTSGAGRVEESPDQGG